MLCQERKRYPVGIGAGLLSETCADIREGKTHCVVWAAGGLGWEKVQGADSASGAPLTQQALLEACLEAQHKAAAQRFLDVTRRMADLEWSRMTLSATRVCAANLR